MQISGHAFYRTKEYVIRKSMLFYMACLTYFCNDFNNKHYKAICALDREQRVRGAPVTLQY
jgi:hypothetical protein